MLRKRIFPAVAMTLCCAALARAEEAKTGGEEEVRKQRVVPAAEIQLPPAAAGGGSICVKRPPVAGRVRPAVEGLPAKRIARAAEASRARELQQVRDAVSGYEGANLGDLQDLGVPLQRNDDSGPFPDPAAGENKSPHQRPAGLPDPLQGRRNSGAGAPGGIGVSNPRDALGGIARQAGGSTRDLIPDQNQVVVQKRVYHADGSVTQHTAYYDGSSGELIRGARVTFDAQDNLTEQVFFENPQRVGERVSIQERTVDPDGETPELIQLRWLGEEKHDPAPRDPGRIADYQPAEGGRGGAPCDLSLYACQRQLELARQFQRSPNRVNPGDADNANPQAAQRLPLKAEDLATDPSPEIIRSRDARSLPQGMRERARQSVIDGGRRE